MAVRKGNQPVLPIKVAKARKPKREPWTLESAQAFIKKNAKNQTKGLTFWSAVDYLKKNHGIIVE